MKRTIIFIVALSANSLLANAQFNIGINGGIVNPTKSVSDSITFLRSGYTINIDPSYAFGKFSINSNLGYQSFNTKSGIDNMARQRNYTADKGYNVSTNSPGFYNAALGAGFNVLPSGISGCGVRKPSLIISSQIGVLKPVNATNAKVSIDQKATIYSLSQSDKALPYFKAGAEIVCPLNNLIALKSGVSYNQTTNDMQFQQSNNGNVSTINTAYSNMQFSIGIQFSFKGIQEKGIKRSAAAKAVNPLYNGSGTQSQNPLNEAKVADPGQPIGGIVVKGGVNADVVRNPLYTGQGTAAENPLHKEEARVAGQPIGGIVVKGGKNPGGNLTILNNGFAIKENGIKKNDFAIKENGIKIAEASSPNNFAIKENGIKSLTTNPNQKGIQENGMKTQAMIYTSDFNVQDPMLLSYLGTSELIIKKGEYVFDYSKNPNGDLKLQLSKNIVHRDIAARNLTFVGINPETKTHFEYTIEPEFVNGIADHIIVSYKGITEKGIK